MYPELITRPEIKMFLPPIGNLTVYICKRIFIRDHAFSYNIDSAFPRSWQPSLLVG